MIKNKSSSSQFRPYFQINVAYYELRCRHHSALDSDKARSFGPIRAVVRMIKIISLANKKKNKRLSKHQTTGKWKFEFMANQVPERTVSGPEKRQKRGSQ